MTFSAITFPGPLFCNLGWLNLNRGLFVDTLPQKEFFSIAQGWFALAEQVTHSLSKCALYGQQLSNLLNLEAMSQEVNTSEYQLDHVDMRSHAQLFGVAKLAVRFTDQAHRLGLVAEEDNWKSIAGNSNAILLRYESTFTIQEMTYKDILRRVALCQKSNRPDLTMLWEEQMRQRYPGDDYKWLHDFQNPYARIALSEAYADLGYLNDAIKVAEEALEDNDWHWGHVIVSEFYSQQGQWQGAERHLHAAIIGVEDPQSRAQYMVMLGDLYMKQGDTQTAKTEYCQVLLETISVDAKGDQNIWRTKALSRLGVVTGMNEINVSALCGAQK